MSEIMKSDAAHIVLLQQMGQMRREVSGLHKLPDLVDIDIIQIIGAVGSAAEPAVFCLLCFEPQKQFLEGSNQRQRPLAGLRLGAVFLNQFRLAVLSHFRDDMTDGDGLALKVDCIPLQT